MMMNLFNMFDPMIMNFPFNWMLIFILTMMLKNNFWLNKFNYLNLISNFNLKEIINNNFFMNKFLINFFNSIFIIIFINNLLNLIPNMFYFTSNIMLTLNYSFYLIMMYFSFMLLNNLNIFFMNLTPKNSPILLSMFINLIELNSFFIQIITLSMRLMINMMLGHTITLILNNYLMIMIYLMIEMMIILIQTYVFFILIMLNSNNIY